MNEEVTLHAVFLEVHKQLGDLLTSTPAMMFLGFFVALMAMRIAKAMIGLSFDSKPKYKLEKSNKQDPNGNDIYWLRSTEDQPKKKVDLSKTEYKPRSSRNKVADTYDHLPTITALGTYSEPDYSGSSSSYDSSSSSSSYCD